MKKFMATAAVLAASAVILAGCGSKNDAADNAQETVTETAAAESGETGETLHASGNGGNRCHPR